MMQTSKVFFAVAMSLDGFIAPEGMELAHIHDPEYKQWSKKWMGLMHWVFQQTFFRENLKIGEGGETGQDNSMQEKTFQRTSVSIMGNRMFSAGEPLWPEEAPFHTPVFVLTNQVRQPWVRPGGTTFYFVNDGTESALRQAREVAGNGDIRIAGGEAIRFVKPSAKRARKPLEWETQLPLCALEQGPKVFGKRIPGCGSRAG